MIDWVPRGILGATFLLSGVAKLAHPGWVEQARGFGTPRWVAALLPYGEIALGAALVAGIAPRASGIVAFAVLLVFSGAIVRHLVAGERPSCACFGVWSARSISARDVLRNAALLVVAGAVIAVGA